MRKQRDGDHTKTLYTHSGVDHGPLSLASPGGVSEMTHLQTPSGTKRPSEHHQVCVLPALQPFKTSKATRFKVDMIDLEQKTTPEPTGWQDRGLRCPGKAGCLIVELNFVFIGINSEGFSFSIIQQHPIFPLHLSQTGGEKLHMSITLAICWPA